MSIIRSTIFEIGDMVDSMNRGDDLHSHVHRLNELRGQLKWIMSNDFPLRPQNLDGREVTVNHLLQTLSFVSHEEGRKLLNKFVYGCIADALNRGPSQAGTESTAAEKESAETSPESKTRPFDLRDQVMLAVLPVFTTNAFNTAKYSSKEERVAMLMDAPAAAYQMADVVLKERGK